MIEKHLPSPLPVWLHPDLNDLAAVNYFGKNAQCLS